MLSFSPLVVCLFVCDYLLCVTCVCVRELHLSVLVSVNYIYPCPSMYVTPQIIQYNKQNTKSFSYFVSNKKGSTANIFFIILTYKENIALVSFVI